MGYGTFGRISDQLRRPALRAGEQRIGQDVAWTMSQASRLLIVAAVRTSLPKFLKRLQSLHHFTARARAQSLEHQSTVRVPRGRVAGDVVNEPHGAVGEQHV